MLEKNTYPKYDHITSDRYLYWDIFIALRVNVSYGMKNKMLQSLIYIT